MDWKRLPSLSSIIIKYLLYSISPVGFRWYTEKNSTSDAYIRNALQIDKSETTSEFIYFMIICFKLVY